jgi:hypothetical protein
MPLLIFAAIVLHKRAEKFSSGKFERMAKPQKTENLVEEICTFVRLGVVIVCLHEVAAQGCSEHRRDGPAHVKIR